MITQHQLCVVELTFRKPKAVQKKTSGTKKRKKDTGKADEAEVNARVGTRSEHFLDSLSSLMNTLDEFGMQDRYLVMDNAAIHKVNETQEAIRLHTFLLTHLF